MQRRLTRRAFVGVACVIALGLTLGMGGLSSATAASAAKVLIIKNFTFTLQPGDWHGFVLGRASVNRGYVVDVSPLDPADGGAHIKALVQPESNGSTWDDVLRVQLLAATTPVQARIRVYAVMRDMSFTRQ